MEKKQTAPTLIVGAAAIDKEIGLIAKAGAKFDNRVQAAGLSVLAHVDKTGDTTLADRLINAMPKGGRKLALAEWMLAYGRMRALSSKDKADADAVKAGRVFQYMHDKSTDMQGATDTPWHEFRKEKAVSDAFDAQAAVKSLLDRLGKAAKDGKTIEHREAALEQARALVAVLEAPPAPATAE